MISLVADRSEEIAELCRTHQVQRLDLFGSAATGDFDLESSDLDFLVTFLPEANATYIGVYHRLYTDLTSLFDRPVDLVIETDFRNPYFRDNGRTIKNANLCRLEQRDNRDICTTSSRPHVSSNSRPMTSTLTITKLTSACNIRSSAS